MGFKRPYFDSRFCTERKLRLRLSRGHSDSFSRLLRPSTSLFRFISYGPSYSSFRYFDLRICMGWNPDISDLQVMVSIHASVWDATAAYIDTQPTF